MRSHAGNARAVAGRWPLLVPGERREDAIPLGAMARIAMNPAVLEAFSGAVGVGAYQQVLSKTLDIRHAAGRKRATDAERALRGAVGWMLCTAHPAGLLQATGARPMEGAPRGFYALAEAHPVVIVSLGELPPGEDTRMLRLLAAELSESERAVVIARLETLGADRLGDVVLDLSAADLARWLADPAAQ